MFECEAPGAVKRRNWEHLKVKFRLVKYVTFYPSKPKTNFKSFIVVSFLQTWYLQCSYITQAEMGFVKMPKQTPNVTSMY